MQVYTAICIPVKFGYLRCMWIDGRTCEGDSYGIKYTYSNFFILKPIMYQVTTLPSTYSHVHALYDCLVFFLSASCKKK